MKIFFIVVLVVSFLHADEMQRIESIVSDITKLRVDYEKCQKSLKGKETIKVNMQKHEKNEDEIREYKRLLRDEREKNDILKDEIESLTMLLIKSKKEKSESKKAPTICIENKSIDQNHFPDLVPKNIKIEEKKIIIEDKIQNFKAAPFCLKIDSSIYDGIDGEKIDEWKKETSFTSNKKTAIWIKITGYFVNQKWQKAKKDMWVLYERVSKK